MRWPLRNQILVRMLLLLVIAIGSLTYASIRSIIAANREAELDKVQRIAELMTTSRFPLTSSVLENMKLLSNAEFVFTEGAGEIVSKTTGVPPSFQDVDLLRKKETEQSTPKSTEVDGKLYYHTAVSGIREHSQTTNAGILHILVPRQSEGTIWWQASKSPLTVALFVLPLALLSSLALASQVTRPLAKLNNQVQQIAVGEVQQIPEVRRNDEIHDLNVSINEMAVKLQDHDAQLRKNERLRTMVQFGNGIAHQLRNSATGCKMAIELLAVEQEKIADSENYQVALRQLELMNNYIKKFLLHSKSSEAMKLDDVGLLDLGGVLENVVFLLRPSAEHLGVDLAIESSCDDSKIKMSEEDAKQLMMNLVTNAIRAASENSANNANSSNNATGGSDGNRKPADCGLVSVTLKVNDGHVIFSVSDNGAGPPEQIAQSIFDPFVTGSKEGTGLGLSLVREISNRVEGRVSWLRENQLTTFCFETGDQQVKEETR